jgi:chorismate mutase
MAQRRRIAVLESQLDASREEVAALTRRLTDALAERDILSREAAASAADARRSRDTLRGALDLIGRLGPA